MWPIFPANDGYIACSLINCLCDFSPKDLICDFVNDKLEKTLTFFTEEVTSVLYN